MKDSKSRTVRLVQQHAQLIRRSFDSHFEGRYSRPGNCRHLIITQLLDVLEQECFSLTGFDSRQRVRDLFPPCHSIKRIRRGRGDQGRLIANERARSPPGSCSRGPTPVDQNAEQPMPEAFTIRTAAERSIGAHESVLDGFLRLGMIAEHPRGIPSCPIAVPIDEDAESLGVTGHDTGDDLRVACHYLGRPRSGVRGHPAEGSARKRSPLAREGATPSSPMRPQGSRIKIF